MGLSWRLATGEIEFRRGLGTSGYAEEGEWPKALLQIERRLQSALQNFSRYNAIVARKLPLACRTGKIQRRLTWPKQVKTAIPRAHIERAQRALDKATALPLLTEMTKRRYLEATAIAYDACFRELRTLSPLQKYQKKADGRHGGLLDLPDGDAEAFSKWYRSHAWAGSHPWEIVFGHPHGIMLSPRFQDGEGRWNYWLWVDSLGWYGHAVKMAIALGECKVPFEFRHGQKVLDALKGLDDIEMGPSLDSLNYEELRRERPDVLKLIRWDTIPELGPISPDQGKRVMQAEKESVPG
jgi:hypothetical protein